MSLVAGTRLGPYEIAATLEAGGQPPLAQEIHAASYGAVRPPAPQSGLGGTTWTASS